MICQKPMALNISFTEDMAKLCNDIDRLQEEISSFRKCEY